MQSYTELTPPTAVTHSLSVPFLSRSANNLIVAKTSLLQIFALKSLITHAASGAARDASRKEGSHGPSSVSMPSALQRTERLQSTKLVLIAQYELSGTVTALARVKILRSRSGGEAVLIALRDAKLSLVEWDPERYSISTISIHYYEQEDVKRSPWDLSLSRSPTYLSVDPSSRCAALKFGARQLAILPFYQEGDDLVMDDYDPEIDGDRPTVKTTEGPLQIDKAPYAPSFVLSLLALDPNLSHPIHLSFLYEYREPTFGVLFSQTSISTALLHERRDNISYVVYTLDLEQQASTTLLSISNLPCDLFLIVPLALPVGGALLVGSNVLIHVDQSGKTNGVAVNQLAKHGSSFGLLDQSDLALRLEECVIENLAADNGDMLIILKTGELAILSFRSEGRSVSGLSVRVVRHPPGEEVLQAAASCTSIIGRGRIFVGSENCDSVAIGWSRRSEKMKRQIQRRSSDVGNFRESSDLEEDEFDEDEDDLYSGLKAESMPKQIASTPSVMAEDEDYVFRVHDSITNLGPIKDFGLIEPAEQHDDSTEAPLITGLIVSSGYGRGGSLGILQRKLEPHLVQKLQIDGATAVWSVCAKPNIGETHGRPVADNGTSYDEYIIANAQTAAGNQSLLYAISATGLKQVDGTDFDPEAGPSVEIGVLTGGTRIIQVLPNEVRTFDNNFGLAQIFPLSEESADTEPKAIKAGFIEPYVLIIRDDSSLMVLNADESGDLDEVERGEALQHNQWASGSLYDDSSDTFRLESDSSDDDEEVGNILLFLLSIAGGLYVYRLPNLKKPVYVAEGLSFLPPFLSRDFAVRRSTAREKLTELLVADLGDITTKSPYLILRSDYNDVVIYQPYQGPKDEGSNITLRFHKIANPHLPLSSDTDEIAEGTCQALRLVPNVGGYSIVFLSGSSPSFILKPASSTLQIIPLRSGEIRSLSSLHVQHCENGFTYVDKDGNIAVTQLPADCLYSTGWIVRKKSFGEDIQAIGYHARSKSCIVGTSLGENYKLPEEESFGVEDTSFLPQVEQGMVKLLDYRTWSIIDRLELDVGEVVMSVKVMSLETSEVTHERKELITVGTAVLRGEELPATGKIYVLDVIDVVPEPGRPETGKKLKMVAKEEVKGAVTALSEIGTQGFLLAAQGQKCMVRGLKEDGTLLPVAFMDMQCYVSAMRELKSTGLCLMGDAIKGLWFAGYTEDPYQLRLFGKSSKHIEVIAADFLPDEKQLYIIAADSDCNIHILQFDPENPKSLSGSHLLPLSSFHAGHFATALTLLPPNSSNPSSPRSVLMATASGVLALISPLPPSSHRTLSALQSHLQSMLPHACGLNPRVYRHVADTDAGGVGWGARGGVVDGNVVRRWNEVGSWRRWGGGGDGRGDAEVREMVRAVQGAGLPF